MESTPPVRVVVTDGMPLFRRGAVGALDEHPKIEVVAQAYDGESALREILRTAPDVAILEVAIPNLDAGELLRSLTRAGSPARVLLVSNDEDPAPVRAAIASGVAGYVSKRADEDELTDATLMVAKGNTVISPSAQAALVQELEAQTERDGKDLSKQETEVLQRIAQGLPAWRIAKALQVSESSVRTYQRRLYSKLEVSTQGAAVAEGLRLSLIVVGRSAPTGPPPGSALTG